MKTSRRELLEWMKSLNIQINKIEELGQGTAICQLLNIIHPSSCLSYIKNPSSEYEYIKNLKLAQNFFYLNSVEVKFPISKLVECKLQDNLEIAQWLYKYYVKCTKNKKNVSEVNNKKSILINKDLTDKKSMSINKDLTDKKSMPINNLITDKDSTNKNIKSSNNIINDNDLINKKSMSINEDLTDKDSNNLINENDSKNIINDSNINILINDKDLNNSTELRKKNRQDIIENLKKHYEEINMKSEDRYNQILEDNKKLNEQIKLKEEENNILKEKLGIFSDKKVQELIKDLEDNRDFYFLILVEIEKYLTGCTNIDEGIKDDIFNILYKKQ